MGVLGIVAEYNPFHNGHKYHLEQSKALCGADYVVCVMSGNFIQRGEPAIVDKWARAEMALLSGADLVIELPVVYAMSTAEFFAFGAVKILDALGVVDSICFGSEAGNIKELDAISDILCHEPQKYKALLQDALSRGLSFPAAREVALHGYLEPGVHGIGNPGEIVSSSNNILGIEYLKALKRLGSKIKPQTIRRITSIYNSEDLEGPISSATAIRKCIRQAACVNSINTGSASQSYNATCASALPASLSAALPGPSFNILQREFEADRGPIFPAAFESILLSALRRMSSEEISKLPYIAEGLENRIKAAADSSGVLDELMEGISTKRYTRTRIQRSLFSLLTGLSHEELSQFNLYGGPQYIRVLGFNNNGRQLLSRINSTSALPVIIKSADFKASCNPLLSKMLKIEAASTDQYVLSYSNPQFRKSGQEFTRSIVYIS